VKTLTAVALLCLLLPAAVLQAQPANLAPSPASVNQADLAKLDQRVTAAQSSADNAWVLVSAALVLMMTGPGLALFYGGLVRQKNTLAIMMQSFALMALITVLWALVGYSLCFGEGTPIIGGFRHVLLRGVGVDPNPDYGGTIPQLTFMVYQLMFAIITPALITGATAERMKFSGTVVFMSLWFLCVYAPLAHMVWGHGGLLNATLGGRFPTLDFAGGTVVHITSGVSALVCALFLGKRKGYPKEPMPPHSLVLSFIGACLLWVGWFGFNAGSALASNGLATSAFVATHFAAVLRSFANIDRMSDLMANSGVPDFGSAPRIRSVIAIHQRTSTSHPSGFLTSGTIIGPPECAAMNKTVVPTAYAPDASAFAGLPW